MIVSVWLIVGVGYRSAVCGLHAGGRAALGIWISHGCWTLCLAFDLKWCSSTTPGGGRKGHGVGRAQEC